MSALLELNLFFLLMAQVYSDKAVTSLKADGTVGCSVHVLVLNFTTEFQRLLMDGRYKFAGLIHVCPTNDEHHEHERTIKT